MKEYKRIKEFKIFNLLILTLDFDGLNDNYRLFGKYIIAQKENDREFWNDWE